MTNDEWLETDGLGGFASGTVAGLRTRCYHALLLAATKPLSAEGADKILYTDTPANDVDATTETEG